MFEIPADRGRFQAPHKSHNSKTGFVFYTLSMAVNKLVT